ncbi:hypothetical protein FAI41_01665 [Acetobacteraceae bacterium]|nr:hypothetical protein FAI41_01665 [Acetobacteraceae bacterium]
MLELPQKFFLNASDQNDIFYQDEGVKVTHEGIQTIDRFYPIRDIRKVYIQKAENRFVWMRVLICLGLFIPAIAMSVNFLGKGPVGFLMIVGLTAPLLLVGGGGIYSLYRPSYYLYVQSFLQESRVLETNSPHQIVRIKKAVLKAVKRIQEEERRLEERGKVLNFF